VSRVYTADVTVRHDELDAFGRVHPAVYLRYLAHAAVEASADAGFDAAWYGGAGGMWLVRRSTFTVADPARAGDRLTIRTWVEDFRRVRSHRRYTIESGDGRRCLDALTDWVYVDATTGRPRRVPADLEAAFGTRTGNGPERAPWVGAPAPAAPARSSHRVRLSEVDPIGHVNNAVYLDIASQAVLDAFEAAGWPLERMVERGGAPLLAAADVEYLEGARYGDRLETATWFEAAADTLAAHQHIIRTGSDRPLVRAVTRWCWPDAAPGGHGTIPPGLLAAVGSLVAA